jgi:uncharacterized protein
MQVIRWKSEVGVGLEQLVLEETLTLNRAQGIVIGERYGLQYALNYSVSCAINWTAQDISIDVLNGEKLFLSADGNGTWRSGDRVIVDTLTGCVDVDISATPFTNTIPIRRLDLIDGERKVIRVAYISVPSLELKPVDQAYTCLKRGKRYRYENLTQAFEVELNVDESGLVLDYPSMFNRIF